MTSSMSHELTTPLRHLLGFADLLSQDPGSRLSEPGLRYLNHMSQAARRMTALVHKLLTFTSLARTPLDISRVCLNKLLQETLLDFQVDLQNRAIHWVLTPLPIVWCDRGQLRLVLENFISNSLKFTRKNGFQRLTGLGLAHARCIIERHGGRTWAEGLVNRGATFYFSLPMSTDARG